MVLAAAALLWLPALTDAAPQGATGNRAATQTGSHRNTPAATTAPATTAPATTAPSTTAPAATAPAAGSPSDTQSASGQDPGSIADNTLANGGGDPLCNNTAALSADARQNCHLWDPASKSVASSGTPESLYPIGNYGLDTHVDTGILDIGNDIANAMQTLIGSVFALVERLVSLAILGISLAFSFSLWRSDRTGQIPTALSNVEHFFTSPLLQITLAVAGVWAISQMIMGRHGRALGGIVAMCLMVIATLIVMQNPRGTLGGFDSFTNNVAQFSVGAVAGHPSASAPTSSYANATESLWQGVGEEPWCDMEFGDVGWCTQPVSNNPELVNYVNTTVLPALAAGKNEYGDGTREPQAQQDREAALLRACLAREFSTTAPCTTGQLWLAFPPGDDARNGLNDHWTLYHWLNGHAKSMTDIRGAGGVGERLTALFLTTLAMFFFLLLLLYIAINLLLAGVIFVVLLLLAGVMALVACFGEWGRHKWTQWALMLFGTLAVRMLFAVYLGVMILASVMMRDVGATLGGWLVQWLLYAIFWWQAWVNRNRLMELFTGQHAAHPGVTAATVALPAYVGARAGVKAAGRAGRYVRDVRRDALEERAHINDRNQIEAEHRTSIAAQRERGEAGDRVLNERAEQMLETHYHRAKGTIQDRVGREQEASRLYERGTALRHEREQRATREPPAVIREEQAAFVQAERIRAGLREDQEYQQARKFVSDADERQRRTGYRYTNAQIADARSAVEREIQAPPDERDYERSLYRLGPDGRKNWVSARHGSPEREAMNTEIDQQIEHDRHALESVRNMPNRLQPPAPHLPPAPARRRPHRYRRPGELIGVERNTRRPE